MLKFEYFEYLFKANGRFGFEVALTSNLLGFSSFEKNCEEAQATLPLEAVALVLKSQPPSGRPFAQNILLLKYI